MRVCSCPLGPSCFFVLESSEFTIEMESHFPPFVTCSKTQRPLSVFCAVTGMQPSIEELGFDSTVRVLTDLETTGNTKYTSAVVSSCGNERPIWASLPLLGRETNVWRVREYDLNVNEDPYLQGNGMIMKTAWRNSARDIYLAIDQPPEGLAKFECGSDVWSTGYPITVQNLRGKTVHDLDIDPPTPVLHRPVLGTVGCPLWEYTSELELLTGFLSALQAHKALCDRGILHCDISPGNVMLTNGQSALLRGFITDLEFARIESPTLSKPQRTATIEVDPQNKKDDRRHVQSTTEPTTRTHITFQSTATVKRGAGMPGTAQFMARRILLQGVDNAMEHIMHEATHDVESFIWVFSYSVMRNLYHRASEQSVQKEVRDERPIFRYLFSQAFGETTPRAIAAQRQSASYCLTFPRDRDVNKIISSFMSDALISFFRVLQGLIHRATDPFDPSPLTHDALLGVVNDAIVSLQEN